MALTLVSVVIPATLFLVLARDDTGSSPFRGSGGLEIGAQAPDFTLTSRSGEAVRLRALRPTPVVLVFWASWCTPCRRELPLLEEAQREYGDALTVLAVNWEDHVEGDVARFLDEVDLELPTYPDPDDRVGDAYRVRGIPLTFFIDGRGVIRDRVYGITSRALLDESLARILPSR